jgi:tRNA-2-methylthio-N6-dimethylallyladenosine synthase
MNRKHTAQSYLDLIEKIRAARPDLLLSGDFIVGFPGETEADFEATLDLVRAVGYGQAYSFKYSPRPGTPAAERAHVDENVKIERLARLQALLKEQQTAAQEKMVGKTVSVLFERPGRMAGQLVGKSQHLQAVHVNAEGVEIGDIRTVEVIKSDPNSLAGKLVAE